MKPLRYLPLLLIPLIAGCATWHWEKRGATAADYDEDEKFCKLHAYSGTDGMVTNVQVRRMHACLESRGWKKRDN
nr:hypothetical protein [Dechloromonas sp.]